MSHSTVLVISKSADDVRMLLAPYDEDLRVDPYLDDDGETTTYNPQSRWDWYAIGGRWSGMLRHRNGSGVDAARKCDLDLDGMRDEAAQSAADRYDRYRTIVDEYGEIVPWAALVEKHTNNKGVIDFDAARDEFRAQPAMDKIREADLMWHLDDLVAHDRDGYIEHARQGAVPGFATLTWKHGWMEQGRMGWWGMSSATQESEREYLAAANKVIDEAPDDAWFTIVDVHI